MGKASRTKQERRELDAKLAGLPPELKQAVLDHLNPADVERVLGAAGLKGIESVAMQAFQKGALVREYARKTWDPKIIRSLIPEGEEPIATRYDPQGDCVHIACASGKVFKVGRERLTQKECEQITPPELGGGRFVAGGGEGKPNPFALGEPYDPDEFKAPEERGRREETPSQIAEQMRELEQAWDDYQAAKLQAYMKAQLEAAKREREQRECRCAPPGEGDPDAPPCPVHPEGGGRDGEQGEQGEQQGEGGEGEQQQQGKGEGPDGMPRQPPPPVPPSFIEQWEMAEARCAEAKLAEQIGPSCMEQECLAESEVMLKGVCDVGPEDRIVPAIEPGPRCAQHARLRLRERGPALLDWNPDE